MIISIDPTKSFAGANKDRILDACGLIPMFVVDAFSAGKATTKDVYGSMVESYGFGDMSSTDWGTVEPDGTYVSSYDEDEDLKPLIELSFPENPVKVYVYQYAIVAVVDPDNTIISRMD